MRGILKNGMFAPTRVCFSKMPYNFLCFAMNSLNTLEKSKEVFTIMECPHTRSS
jgi:hypothetical protein